MFNTIREYKTVKFNAIRNVGKTLKAEACGISYRLACDFGVSLSSLVNGGLALVWLC